MDFPLLRRRPKCVLYVHKLLGKVLLKIIRLSISQLGENVINRSFSKPYKSFEQNSYIYKVSMCASMLYRAYQIKAPNETKNSKT